MYTLEDTPMAAKKTARLVQAWLTRDSGETGRIFLWEKVRPSFHRIDREWHGNAMLDDVDAQEMYEEEVWAIGIKVPRRGTAVQLTTKQFREIREMFSWCSR